MEEVCIVCGTNEGPWFVFSTSRAMDVECAVCLKCAEKHYRERVQALKDAQGIQGQDTEGKMAEEA